MRRRGLHADVACKGGHSKMEHDLQVRVATAAHDPKHVDIAIHQTLPDDEFQPLFHLRLTLAQARELGTGLFAAIPWAGKS